MSDLLFADGFAAGAATRLAEYAIKCLAVAGGFLVGYFAGKLVAWALDRWVFAQKAPDQLKRACAFAGGLAAAIVVALIVFGSGGGGLFGGGGPGAGTAPTEEKGKPAAPRREDPKVEPPKIEPEPADPKPTPGDVRVTILSGKDVIDGKFYLIGSDSTPRTLDELKKAVADRPKDEPPVVLVFRFAKEPLSSTHRDMKELTAWVREAKIQSRFE